jgi:hypothetical protein
MTKDNIKEFLLNNLKTEKIPSISIGDAWSKLQLLSSHVVRQLETFGNDIKGKEKKEIALLIIDKFYDNTFVAIGIPFIPRFLESILHSYIKSILMILVSRSIDIFVRIFKDTGVFTKNKEELQNG